MMDAPSPLTKAPYFSRWRASVVAANAPVTTDWCQLDYYEDVKRVYISNRRRWWNSEAMSATNRTSRTLMVNKGCLVQFQLAGDKSWETPSLSQKREKKSLVYRTSSSSSSAVPGWNVSQGSIEGLASRRSILCESHHGFSPTPSPPSKEKRLASRRPEKTPPSFLEFFFLLIFFFFYFLLALL